MITTLPPYDTTDEEFNQIVVDTNKRMSRCVHDWMSVYPEEDSPFPVLEVLECRKCHKAKSGGWVIRENGKTTPTKVHGMGFGMFRGQRWEDYE